MPISRVGRVGRATRAGGGQPITSISGVSSVVSIAEARSRGLLFQDAAKTTRALVTTDPVRVVVDPNFPLIQYTANFDSERPILTSSGSRWFLVFDGSGQCLDFTAIPSRPLSIHGAFRLASLATDQVFVCSNGEGQKFKFNDHVNGDKMVGGVNAVSNWTGSTTVNLINTDYSGGINYGSTGDAIYYRNGAADGTADADVSNDSLGVGISRIGFNFSSSEFFNGRLYGWVFAQQKLSVLEIAAIHTYLRSL